MQKPSGYDEARVSGEYTPVEVGGHYCVIKNVAEKVSNSGKPMIVVSFDFCSPDKQEGYFMKSYREDIREDKKWSFQGTKYIMVQDYKDPSKTSKTFKTFCSCVEKSNHYDIAWGGNDWGKQFVNKKIGAVYGMEENEYDGKITKRAVPKWFCQWDAVATASIPEEKLVNRSAAAPVTSDGFMAIPDNVEEEIPF